MSTFLSSFASYLIKMIILVAVGLLGGFIGIKLRISSNKKAEAEEAMANRDSDLE